MLWSQSPDVQSQVGRDNSITKLWAEKCIVPDSYLTPTVLTSEEDLQHIYSTTAISPNFLDRYSYAECRNDEGFPLSNGQTPYIPPMASSSFGINEVWPSSSADRTSDKPRQVGSAALTQASTARRRTRRPPRYFCEVEGCSSEGFTAKHNYECQS